jgi:hypothetical protein
VTALPFTVSATADMAFLLEIGPKALFFAPTGGAGGRAGQNRVVLGIFCRITALLWQPSNKANLERTDTIFPIGKPSKSRAGDS